MGSHVHGEIAFLGKSLVASLTGVWLVSGVSSHVRSEVGFLPESLPTHPTGVRSIAGSASRHVQCYQ